MSRPLGVLVALSVAGCASGGQPVPGVNPNPAAPSPASEADAPVVTLERTACYGLCPVYRVSISPSGLVSWVGSTNVAAVGPASAQITPAAVEGLLDELRAGGYLSFADRYVAGAPACGLYATDSPSAISWAALDGRSKRIEHDYGCTDAPPALAHLERRIDEVAGSARWTGR